MEDSNFTAPGIDQPVFQQLGIGKLIRDQRNAHRCEHAMGELVNEARPLIEDLGISIRSEHLILDAMDMHSTTTPSKKQIAITARTVARLERLLQAS